MDIPIIFHYPIFKQFCCLNFSTAQANHHGTFNRTTIEGAFSKNLNPSSTIDKERRLIHGIRQFRELMPKREYGTMAGLPTKQDEAALRKKHKKQAAELRGQQEQETFELLAQQEQEAAARELEMENLTPVLDQILKFSYEIFKTFKRSNNIFKHGVH